MKQSGCKSKYDRPMESKGKYINREQLSSPYGLLGGVSAEPMPELPPLNQNYELSKNMDSDESDSIETEYEYDQEPVSVVHKSLPNGVYLTEANGLFDNAGFGRIPSVRVNALRTFELLLRVPTRSMSRGPCLIEAKELFSNQTRVQLFGQEVRLFDFGPDISAGKYLNNGQETGSSLHHPPAANSYGVFSPLNAPGNTAASINLGIETNVDCEPETIPWTCSKCNSLNSSYVFYCGKCKACKMDKAPSGGDTIRNCNTAECDNDIHEERGNITQLHHENYDQSNTTSDYKCSKSQRSMNDKGPNATITEHNTQEVNDDMAEGDNDGTITRATETKECSHVDTESTIECSKCNERRDENLQVEENFVEAVSESDVGTSIRLTSQRSPSCFELQDGKSSTMPHDYYTGDDGTLESDDEIASEVEDIITAWTCDKCNRANIKSRTKCSRCLNWKCEKTPTKSSTDSAQELPPILSKNEYKPLFEVNDHVYAPWCSSGKSKAEQSWYPGKVKSYTTLKNGEYGPIRRYDIRFDDGDELDDIEDYCIFSREDYLLSEKKDWIGVENVFDGKSKDPWARKVGWYEVTIGESCPTTTLFSIMRNLSHLSSGQEIYVFSQLYEALKAYDVHMAGKSGRNGRLNLPDEIINKCTR